MTLTDKVTVYQMDCMEYMATLPDKAFELAICDPPYGIGDRLVDGGGTNAMIKWQGDYRKTHWDQSAPQKQFFDELFRVTENQIIWGGNYFGLRPFRTFVVWDKMTYIQTMSQVELAWTSFDEPARLIKINSTDLNRIHPTQKPVALYRWLLTHYAKPGDRILDTHFGSLSSGIACHTEGFEYVGCELDESYFTAAISRFQKVTSQLRMFK